MKMINFDREISKCGNAYTINIKTSKINEESKVWLEYQLSGCKETNTIEARYVGDKYSSSCWIIEAELPAQCNCIIYGKSGDLQAACGVLIKSKDIWTYTGEYSDYSIDIVSLNLTYNCNLKCSMCWQANYKKKNNINTGHMKYDDFLNIMNKISFLAPAKLYLWGGEPLLHPDFAEIVREVKAKKFTCNLITNGMLLKEKSEDILREKIDTLCVSLDGVGAFHDRIRGVDGAYDQIINGLKHLIKSKAFRPVISVNMVINTGNYMHIYDAVKEFASLGVNGIQVQYPVHFDNETGLSSQTFIKEKLGIDIDRWRGFIGDYSSINLEILGSQISKIKSDFKNVGLYPGNIDPNEWFGDSKLNRRISCSTPWKRLNIEPNGDVNICNDHGDMVAGNIINSDMKTIWNNEAFMTFRREVLETGFMSMCRHCTYSYL